MPLFRETDLFLLLFLIEHIFIDLLQMSNFLHEVDTHVQYMVDSLHSCPYKSPHPWRDCGS